MLCAETLEWQGQKDLNPRHTVFECLLFHFQALRGFAQIRIIKPFIAHRFLKLNEFFAFFRFCSGQIVGNFLSIAIDCKIAATNCTLWLLKLRVNANCIFTKILPY